MTHDDNEKTYWQGRRDGTAIFAEKERELVVKITENEKLAILVDDLRHQLRDKDKEVYQARQLYAEFSNKYATVNTALGNKLGELRELNTLYTVQCEEYKKLEEEIEEMRTADSTELAAQLLEQKMLVKRLQEGVDSCWHCHTALEPQIPQCDQCPPLGDCDDVHCLEPGCQVEEDRYATVGVAPAEPERQVGGER